jgi:hypothetical protein
MLNKVRAWFGHIALYPLVGYGALVVLVFFLFFWHMSSYTQGLSPAESTARNGSLSLHNIYNNPVNAPYKFLQYLFLKISPHSLASLKIVPALMACVFGFCFYKLSSSWFGKLVGIFGTLIFISLPIFVISARQATAEIMLFSTISLMWLYIWFKKPKANKPMAWLALCAVIGLLLYTPGIIWLLVACAAILHKKLLNTSAEMPRLTWVSGPAITLILILPLVISGISHPDSIKQLLLIPGSWLPATELAKNFAWSIAAIFLRAPLHPFVIGNLPILNVVASVLAIFGIYAMQAAARAKTLWLSALLIFGIIAAGINDNIAFLALGLPAFAIFISAGLRYLYIEWRAIFPRNPVPKTFALFLIAAVVFSQVYYGVMYSLVAWPHTTATRQVYVLK